VNPWIRSSYCASGTCVEIRWVQASACGGGTCVQARSVDGVVQVRDSKNPDGPVLEFDRAEWDAFVAGVAAGEFRFEDGAR
jgi:hypothetical protein